MNGGNQAALPAPSPEISPELAEFWAATTQGRLLLPRCRACGEAFWYPRPACPFCHAADTAWEQASGGGRIYTYTIVRRGAGAYADAPYVLAYVELDEGPRMMTNIVDCAFDDLEIGLPVEVVFHRAGDGAALPRFRPAS